MANLKVRNADGDDVFLQASGTGTEGDPHIPRHADPSSLPLPTGAATAANQVTLDAALASLLTELQAKADLGETQPVSGPLTDAQLRAAAVPVSGSFTNATSENHLGEVGGNSLPLSVGITGSLTAYSLNDVVGGKLTLTAAMRKSNGSGVLQNVVLVDTANVKPPLVCLLFSRDLAGTYTDNAAFTLNTTDAGFLIGAFPIGVSDWQQIGGTNLAVAVPSQQLPTVVAASNNQANLYAVLVATATFTLTSTTQLRLSLGLARD